MLGFTKNCSKRKNFENSDFVIDSLKLLQCELKLFHDFLDFVCTSVQHRVQVPADVNPTMIQISQK